MNIEITYGRKLVKQQNIFFLVCSRHILVHMPKYIITCLDKKIIPASNPSSWYFQINKHMPCKCVLISPARQGVYLQSVDPRFSTPPELIYMSDKWT